MPNAPDFPPAVLVFASGAGAMGAAKAGAVSCVDMGDPDRDYNAIIGITAIIIGLELPLLHRWHAHWALALLFMAATVAGAWALILLVLNVQNIRDWWRRG